MSKRGSLCVSWVPISATGKKMMPSNSRNDVRLQGGIVVKRSAAGDNLLGELFFYQELNKRLPRLRHLFPLLLSGSSTRLDLEFVRSIPLTRIFVGGHMQFCHIDAVFASLDALHEVSESEVTLSTSSSAVKGFLVEKLVARFSGPAFSDLAEAPAILRLLLERIDEYAPRVVRVIHGDAWFANILVEEGWERDESERKIKLRFVDMRGRVGDELTLNGDAVYDYAKIMQSLLGFDEAVFNFSPVPQGYRQHLLLHFCSLLRKRSVRPYDVLSISLCLMAGSIPFHVQRERLWNLIRSLVTSDIF